MADLYVSRLALNEIRGVAIAISTVHDFHGSADNPCATPSCLQSSSRPDASTANCFGCFFILADKKTSLSFQAMGAAVDVDSEVYCWRRGGVFWRMRASHGLACAQASY